MNSKILLLLCALSVVAKVAIAFNRMLTSPQSRFSASSRRLYQSTSVNKKQASAGNAQAPRQPSVASTPLFVSEADTHLVDKPVYAFGKLAQSAGAAAVDRGGAKSLLGGKGANLADMARVSIFPILYNLP